MEQTFTPDEEQDPVEKNQTSSVAYQVNNSNELQVKTEASENASNEGGRNSNWGEQQYGYGYGDLTIFWQTEIKS